MVLFLSRNEVSTLRNGADILLRQFMSLFGDIGLYIISTSFFLIFLIIFLLQKKNINETSIKSKYLLFMLFEGLIWGIVLYFFMLFSQTLLMFPTSKELISQIILSIGAGLYEELVFRVLLIMFLTKLIKIIFLWNYLICLLVSMTLSAIVFSYFHFLGPYGDPLSFSVFIYRFLGGFFLGFLYILRGFGITAYAHINYNLIIIFFLTTNE
tara:strand:- start:32415 stop:33047 length:633 start_codon:yes stop_codon:yes gene_type:complete